ncbi:hypothetical protein RFI_07715 [Reticulomyxa filosa]|uniref:Uncharacterized protein n=1 Tax=Reticulomyxa filosa TaxID=46433 RepID=X6NUF1_RETFI|nr:hypothetical protein RFI_07715 [Reticulomyxa filosa]|eukprot:ETO29404.1 hypothetical protein RFI_07715 [Reticulomyxa filosa]
MKSGVWTIASIISNLTNNAANVSHYLKNIQDTFSEVNTAIVTGAYNSTSFDLYIEGIDEGLSGMLFAGMLVNEWYGKIIVDPNMMKNISYFIIQRGMASGEMFGHDWMMFENPNLPGCYDWGMGHGNGGRF